MFETVKRQKCSVRYASSRRRDRMGSWGTKESVIVSGDVLFRGTKNEIRTTVIFFWQVKRKIPTQSGVPETIKVTVIPWFEVPLREWWLGRHVSCQWDLVRPQECWICQGFFNGSVKMKWVFRLPGFISRSEMGPDGQLQNAINKPIRRSLIWDSD